MTATALATTAAAQLTASLGRTSLADLRRARLRRSLLLVDTSGSMNDAIVQGGRKIDALREVATELRQSHPVPLVNFGETIGVVEQIPEPDGLTPLAQAIRFAKAQGASHAVVITDGIADDEDDALAAARAFGGPIDAFYIGDGNDQGAAFCQQLARLTGGSVNVTDLGAPKQLASSIAGLLGDGSAL